MQTTVTLHDTFSVSDSSSTLTGSWDQKSLTASIRSYAPYTQVEIWQNNRLQLRQHVCSDKEITCLTDREIDPTQPVTITLKSSKYYPDLPEFVRYQRTRQAYGYAV